jgi:hypothetical protein
MQKFGKRKGPLGDKRVNKHINTSQIANNVNLILMKKDFTIHNYHPI